MSARPADWRPLLSPDETSQALEVVREIAEALERWNTSPAAETPLPMGRARFSLAGGWAGQALFFAYLDRAFPGEGHLETAAALLDRAFDDLGRSSAQLGLFSGLTGVAWTAEHLRDELFEEGEDPGEEIAGRLAALLATSPWPLEHDLIGGLVGFGVWALERCPLPFGRSSVAAAVARFDELAEHGSRGVSWRLREEELPRPLRLGGEGYNLGTAHGVPGVIGFLGQVRAAGLDEARAPSLLAGAVPWLLSHQNPPGAPCRFPPTAVPGRDGEPTRLAWCYGDLGIAAALLVAAGGADEEGWRQAALDLARSAARREGEVEEAREAGLCHGAAGNGHLFNRLWQQTGDAELAGAARSWLDRTLSLRCPGEGLAGFLTYLPDAGAKPGFRSDPGFLTGVAGIGLALLAAATPIEPAWDRLLLAS